MSLVVLIGVMFVIRPLTNVTRIMRDIASQIQQLRETRVMEPSLSNITSRVHHSTVGCLLQVSEVRELRKAFVEMMSVLTEVQSDREKLIRDQTAEQQFITEISHDIRTPLHGILGLVEMLYIDLNPLLKRHQHESFSNILSTGDQLNTLLTDIIDLSRIHNGKMKIQKESVNVSEAIITCCEIFRNRLSSSKVSLINSSIATTIFALADRHRLMQILNNFLSNAIKFTSNGQIQILCSQLAAGDILRHMGIPSIYRGEQYQKRISFPIGAIDIDHNTPMVCCVVTDTGRGIPSDQLDRVFQLFSQFQPNDAAVGSGLGLSISRQLSHLMGGFVGLSSCENLGSAFWVALPAIPHSDCFIPHNSSCENRDLDMPTYELPVLVVDDNTVNRILVVKMLDQLGFKSIEAEDGEECLEKCENQQFGMILLDMNMPRLSGIETIKIIRKHCKEVIRKTRVICSSANNMLEHREAAISAGMDDYLAKPFRLCDLKRLIAEHYGQHSLMISY
eukprot:NODE_831_length_2322_cov_11.808549_g707_i0.p1 GENE.NODE_831_length_2322_cov_11.808549_g707_i0~~NODE_831_length_2322_cov_11.808549_g707_i0.p1  ORF type:complete len:521 (-),score=53.02 NODE_831_length_2322_cov_11.808549_g707_i0:759-2276(-)